MASEGGPPGRVGDGGEERMERRTALLGTADLGVLAGAGADDESNNEAVQAQSLSENENEDDTDVQLLLLANGPDAGVTNDTDRHTGREAAEATAEAGGKMGVSRVGRVRGLLGLGVRLANWARSD